METLIKYEIIRIHTSRAINLSVYNLSELFLCSVKDFRVLSLY